MYRVLIVEDDADLAELTQVYLSHDGYQVDIASSFREGLDKMQKTSFDLVLLDEVLPDGRGTALCQEMRNRCSCPIIFISCLDDSETIIKAFRGGGDDYVVKPVNYGELMERVRDMLHKFGGTTPRNANHIRRFRQFSVDTARHRVIREGTEVDLSAIEYGLLFYMTEHPNSLLLYNELYQQVWDTDSLGDVRTVMVHISNLRKKIDPYHTGLIETVRGAGYIFTDVKEA